MADDLYVALPSLSIQDQMKKLLFATLLFCGVNAHSQNMPTIVSYTVDTLCSSDWQELFLTITIEDLDGDSTYFMSVTNNDTYLGTSFNVVPPATFSGETQRTFEIYGDAGFGLANGFNLASINIEVAGNANNDGGNLDQDLNDMVVQGPINVTLDFGTETFCTSDNPVDVTPYASPAGGVFYHSGEDPHPNMIDMEKFYNDPGDGIFYLYTDALGCTAETSDWPTVFQAPFVSVLPSDATCGNADGSATANISGQYPPFDAVWTTGFTEQVSSMSSVSNLSSGTYYVNVFDANGCYGTAAAQISDGDLSVTESITDQTCPGSGNGAIDLTISGGGNVDNIWWSNGQTTEDITGLMGGNYTVQIHTDQNCQAFKTYTVSNPAPIGIMVNNIDPADCFQGFDGNIDITTTGGSGSYTWDWDSGTAMTEDFMAPGVGPHNCVVTDQVTGCTHSWDVTVPEMNGPWVWIDEIVKPTCLFADGEIDLGVQENWAPITSITWSNSATTEDLTGITAGTYSVEVEDQNGCKSIISVEVPNALPYQPSLCVLTVDTSFTYNQVVWEKDVLQSIEGFRVYRETNIQGEFELVAERPYTLDSEFMDNAASPVDRSWRYYLTTYDACGNESYPSFIHKTIHTVANDVGGGNFEVMWDEYEGIDYSSVDLFRHDNTNGWQNIGNFAVGVHSTTDAPPILAGLDYIVSFNLSNTCTSSKAQDYNSSRSNNSSATYEPGGSTTSIETNNEGEINIYPNPTNNFLSVYVEFPAKFEFIQLTDVNGRIIYLNNLSQSMNSIDLSNFNSGVYFVHLISGSETFVQKVIKN